MIYDNVILLFIFAIGLLFGNRLVAGATGALLALKLIRLPMLMHLLERRALDAGLFFLLLAVLIPFALDRVGTREIIDTFRNMPGVIAVIGGAIAAYVCGEGVALLQIRPEINVGLLLGTIVGVALLRGVPVGPLAAAGITAIILNIFGLSKR